MSDGDLGEHYAFEERFTDSVHFDDDREKAWFELENSRWINNSFERMKSLAQKIRHKAISSRKKGFDVTKTQMGRRLRNFLEYLQYPDHESLRLFEADYFLSISESLNEAHFAFLDRNFNKDEQTILLAFSFLWLRELPTDGEYTFTEITRFLLEKDQHSGRSLFDWLTVAEIRRSPLFFLFAVVIGAKGSFVQVGRELHWRVGEHFQYFLEKLLREFEDATQPGYITLESLNDYMLAAEIFAIGGGWRDYRSIRFASQRNPNNDCLRLYTWYFEHADSMDGWEVRFRGFFRDTVLWLSTHGNKLSTKQRARIVSFAHHHFWDWRGWFFLQNQGAEVALQAEKEQPFCIHDWNYTLYGHGFEWKFTELLSWKEVQEEAQALNHYLQRETNEYIQLRRAFVSVRKSGIPSLIIELDAESRQCGVIAGKSDRRPTCEEREIIDQWLRTCVKASPGDT